MLQMLQLLSGAGGAKALHPEDVFSTYLYNGTGAALPIVNGIDQSGGDGSMTWIKKRNAIYDHTLLDTNRGANYLISNSTAQQLGAGDAFTPTSSGFLLSSSSLTNTAGAAYAAWTFKQAPKFFFKTLQAHTSGTPNTVDLSSLGTVGLVAVKSTLNSGAWYVFHRSLTTGKLLYLNTTAAETTDASISVSGTTLTLGSTLATDTYIVYAWAHDVSADGIIQCGSFTTDAGGIATVNLGWEPQFTVNKALQSIDSWLMCDSCRGYPAGVVVQSKRLFPNLSSAEDNGYATNPIATGFTSVGSANTTYIYLAIRRPTKVPTSGTEVYSGIARVGTGVVTTITGVGFAPDSVLPFLRSGGQNHWCFDRLRGATNGIQTNSTITEQVNYGLVTSFEMDGVTVVANDAAVNQNGLLYINHFFRRAPKFMDIVCDTGVTGAHGITHNLTISPELYFRKSRSNATQWEVWHSALAASEKLVLNSTAAKATDATAWNSTLPTSTQFTVGTGANVNTNGATYVTYLFATLAGVSKVGSYTGNGSSLNLDCGFSTGARFFLVKATSTTGNWWVYDSVRGIIAANDPVLALNSTAAEVTTDDSVDPYAAGITVNQVAATNINVLNGQYIYLAIA